MLHAIAVAEGDGAVFLGLVVDGDAEGGAERVHAAVALADGILLLVEAPEVAAAAVHELAGDLWQTVFLGERQYSQLGGSEEGWQGQDGAAVRLAFGAQVFFLERMAEHHQNRAVEADGGLDDVGDVVLVDFGVEIGELFTAQLCVCLQVEIGAGVDAFHFLEAEGELKLDVAGGIGVVGQLYVVVEAV